MSIRKIFIIFLALILPKICFAETAMDRIRRTFNAANAGLLDEYAVQTAISQVIPFGSNGKEVLAQLEKRGLDFRGTCFPCDTSPICCKLQSTYGTKKENDPNFFIEFMFDKNGGLRDIQVTRYYSDIARTYTTSAVKPNKDIKLKSGLGIGSKVKELEKVYGKWKMDEVALPEWPLVLDFLSEDGKLILSVGVEIGEISYKELQELEKDQNRLGDFPIGIVLYKQ